jgi:hypothetical protein
MVAPFVNFLLWQQSAALAGLDSIEGLRESRNLPAVDATHAGWMTARAARSWHPFGF